eukprot:5481771-Pleurochrysis_carterae.AAC.1
MIPRLQQRELHPNGHRQRDSSEQAPAKPWLLKLADLKRADVWTAYSRQVILCSESYMSPL